MQPRTIKKRLARMYDAMLGHFGHQGWWPGDTAVEICVGAILTQNTNWGNVEKAISNLKAAGRMNVAALHAIGHGELAELIRPAGYFNVKARRLKNFIARVREAADGDLGSFLDRPVAALRADLLGVNGIGPETADSMILYAAGKATFVVDAYTCRIARRHGLIDGADGYETVKALFEGALDRDAGLWNDYHAQMVAVGKTYCRPRVPRCDGCPLHQFPRDPSAD